MRIHSAETLERKAIRFTRGDRLTRFILRRRRRGKIWRRGKRRALVGFSWIGRNLRRRTALLGNGAGELLFRERLAVPAHFPGNFAEAVAFDRARQDRLGAAFRRFGAIERREN